MSTLLSFQVVVPVLEFSYGSEFHISTVFYVLGQITTIFILIPFSYDRFLCSLVISSHTNLIILVM